MTQFQSSLFKSQSGLKIAIIFVAFFLEGLAIQALALVLMFILSFLGTNWKSISFAQVTVLIISIVWMFLISLNNIITIDHLKWFFCFYFLCLISTAQLEHLKDLQAKRFFQLSFLLIVVLIGIESCIFYIQNEFLEITYFTKTKNLFGTMATMWSVLFLRQSTQEKFSVGMLVFGIFCQLFFIVLLYHFNSLGGIISCLLIIMLCLYVRWIPQRLQLLGLKIAAFLFLMIFCISILLYNNDLSIWVLKNKPAIHYDIFIRTSLLDFPSISILGSGTDLFMSAAGDLRVPHNTLMSYILVYGMFSPFVL